jgi:hypothetical protein
MDSVQPKIATDPKDPAWQTFADTLPGFRDYWAGVGERLVVEQAGSGHGRRRR